MPSLLKNLSATATCTFQVHGILFIFEYIQKAVFHILICFPINTCYINSTSNSSLAMLSEPLEHFTKPNAPSHITVEFSACFTEKNKTNPTDHINVSAFPKSLGKQKAGLGSLTFQH